VILNSRIVLLTGGDRDIPQRNGSYSKLGKNLLCS
jgi:hypothetical protein